MGSWDTLIGSSGLLIACSKQRGEKEKSWRNRTDTRQCGPARKEEGGEGEGAEAINGDRREIVIAESAGQAASSCASLLEVVHLSKGDGSYNLTGHHQE